MKDLLLPAILAFTLPALGAEKNHSMKDMHGGCENYKMELKNEFALWAAGAKEADANNPLPLSQRLTLNLTEEKKIKFPVKPGKSFRSKSDSYAGTFRFIPDFDGALHVSAGSKLWLDIVEPNAKAAVESDTFEMQTGCDKIFKVVRFSVRKGTQYTLQVSGSKTASANFLLTRH